MGAAVTPDGTKVYIANFEDETVSVINTATNTVTNPNRIAPVRSKLTVNGGRLEHVLPPYSIQVLAIDLK